MILVLEYAQKIDQWWGETGCTEYARLLA
jgi:hypothetical protein